MENERKIYPVGIIGMGPSGIAAAIYLKRSNISPLCFEQSQVGGKLNIIKEIENYPGFMGEGKELAEKLQKQAAHFEIEIRSESVRSVTQNEDGTFTLKTDRAEYLFQAVIITAGIRDKPFAVKGSETYMENGLSRCAECDAPFHKGKPVAVIGSTSEALKDSVYLASVCSPVYLINPSGQFAASEAEVKNFSSLPNAQIVAPFEIESSQGQRHLEKLNLLNKATGERKTLDVEALFIFLGSTPMSEFLGYMDVLDEKGQIKTDEHMATSVPGLFAAGDVRATPLRQVITAVSDGGIAAVSCRGYLSQLKKK
jgi:thioredoxin reductase (NADPH)